jgi:ParB family chromosome partitioning protein
MTLEETEMEQKKTVRSALGRGLSALISTPPVSVVPPSNSSSTNSNLVPFERSQGETESGRASAAAMAMTVSASNGSAPSGAGTTQGEGVRYLPIESVIPNPKQPRQEFLQTELQELSDSIKTLGILQPVLVRTPLGDDSGKIFEIVAGERRWRAAKLAGLTQIPALIRTLTERETLEIALVENIQRANLNPIEEATGYQRLVDEFGLSQQTVAERVGKDRASVANYLRLLKLPEFVLGLLKEGKISIGHAKAILTVREPAAQASLARKILAENLSVRQLESIVSRSVKLDNNRTRESGGEVGEESSSTTAIMDRLRRSLGTKVLLSHHRSGRGKIVVEYFSEQELGRIVDQMCGEKTSNS